MFNKRNAITCVAQNEFPYVTEGLEVMTQNPEVYLPATLLNGTKLTGKYELHARPEEYKGILYKDGKEVENPSEVERQILDLLNEYKIINRMTPIAIDGKTKPNISQFKRV